MMEGACQLSLIIALCALRVVCGVLVMSEFRKVQFHRENNLRCATSCSWDASCWGYYVEDEHPCKFILVEDVAGFCAPLTPVSCYERKVAPTPPTAVPQAVSTARVTTLEPTTAEPTTLEPSTVAPTTVAPTTVAPTTVAPTTVAPTTVAPTTVAPTTAEPTTVAPTTARPTTVAPTTLEPTTVAPTTVAPTTVAPTTAEPTTVAPTPPPFFAIEAALQKEEANEVMILFRGEDSILMYDDDANKIMDWNNPKKVFYRSTLFPDLPSTMTSLYFVKAQEKHTYVIDAYTMIEEHMDINNIYYKQPASRRTIQEEFGSSAPNRVVTADFDDDVPYVILITGDTLYQFQMVLLPPNATYTFMVSVDLTVSTNPLYPFLTGAAPHNVTSIVRTDKRYLNAFVDNFYYFYDQDDQIWSSHGLINITVMPVN